MIVDEKVSDDDRYSAGYCPELRKYVLSITMKQGDCLYNRYFEIAKNEYDEFDLLSGLVDSLNEKGQTSDRFLYSELFDENTDESRRYRKFFQFLFTFLRLYDII